MLFNRFMSNGHTIRRCSNKNLTLWSTLTKKKNCLSKGVPSISLFLLYFSILLPSLLRPWFKLQPSHLVVRVSSNLWSKSNFYNPKYPSVSPSMRLIKPRISSLMLAKPTSVTGYIMPQEGYILPNGLFKRYYWIKSISISNTALGSKHRLEVHHRSAIINSKWITDSGYMNICSCIWLASMSNHKILSVTKRPDLHVDLIWISSITVQ
jgi:hypothetical protein